MPTQAINALIVSCLLALAVGAAVVALGRLRKKRTPDPASRDPLGTLWPASFLLGAAGAYRWLLGEPPGFPPREATEAFILFIVPLAAVGDALLPAAGGRAWGRWILWIVAALATPGLLFANRLRDMLEGATSATPAQTYAMLGCSIAGLAIGSLALGSALRVKAREDGFDLANWLPLALIIPTALAGVTLLASGSYRLGALALAAVAAPLAGAAGVLVTGCPQFRPNFGPMMLILPIGSLIVLGHELAGLSAAHAAFLAASLIAPSAAFLPFVRTALRQRWQAVGLIVLLGAVPGLMAAIPAALAAARAAASNDGY